jgi:hypothetical protein
MLNSVSERSHDTSWQRKLTMLSRRWSKVPSTTSLFLSFFQKGALLLIIFNDIKEELENNKSSKRNKNQRILSCLAILTVQVWLRVLLFGRPRLIHARSLLCKPVLSGKRC